MQTKLQHKNIAVKRYLAVKQNRNRTMDRSEAPPTVLFLCRVSIYFCLKNCVNSNLGDGTKYLLMMACFSQNDISLLLFCFFW